MQNCEWKCQACPTLCSGLTGVLQAKLSGYAQSQTITCLPVTAAIWPIECPDPQVLGKPLFCTCRLFENTFQLDVMSARDFCEADDRWMQAVQFLDADAKAGWELLAAMLNPNWRLRPTADSCLVHRFLTG